MATRHTPNHRNPTVASPRKKKSRHFCHCRHEDAEARAGSRRALIPRESAPRRCGVQLFSINAAPTTGQGSDSLSTTTDQAHHETMAKPLSKPRMISLRAARRHRRSHSQGQITNDDGEGLHSFLRLASPNGQEDRQRGPLGDGVHKQPTTNAAKNAVARLM